jgi:Ca2+-binding EF-hand superfamily protein
MTEQRQPPPSSLRAKFGVQKRSSSLKLSSRTLNVYKEAFCAIDKTGTGSINKTQLKTVLSKLGTLQLHDPDLLISSFDLMVFFNLPPCRNYLILLLIC